MATPGSAIREPTTFGPLLRSYRARAGLSQSRFYPLAGCHPSYGTRLELQQRNPPSRPFVETFARILRLTQAERNRLLAAAGYLPTPWDEALERLGSVLADAHVSEADRDELRTVVGAITARWAGRAGGRS